MNLVAVVDAPVPGFRTVAVAGVTAVVDDALPDGPADVLRHGAAVDRVFASCAAVLPARAGTRLPDESAVRSWLEQEHVRLERALDQVRGRAEIALTWHADETAALPSGSGTDYLQALAARAALARDATDQLEMVRGLPEVSAVRTLAQTSTTVKASVLVSRDDAESVRAHLAAMGSPSGRWTATGPYPPYSFAEGDWA